MQQINLRLSTPLSRIVPSGSPTDCVGRTSVAEAVVEHGLVSEMVAELLAALDREKVTYCHWKSNWRLDDWLSGEGDLDLLIARGDVDAFVSVLSQKGFKKAIARA